MMKRSDYKYSKEIEWEPPQVALKKMMDPVLKSGIDELAVESKQLEISEPVLETQMPLTIPILDLHARPTRSSRTRDIS
jgi:hypothetical protein